MTRALLVLRIVAAIGVLGVLIALWRIGRF